MRVASVVFGLLTLGGCSLLLDPGSHSAEHTGGMDAGVDAGPGGDDAATDAAVGDAGRDAGREAIDAGEGDAGEADAGEGDAGEADAGEADAGPPDAGRMDAGPPDAGRMDAGRMDAGGMDAGRPDAGRPDAGRPDAGRPDAGRPDAGGTIGECALGPSPSPFWIDPMITVRPTVCPYTRHVAASVAVTPPARRELALAGTPSGTLLGQAFLTWLQGGELPFEGRMGIYDVPETEATGIDLTPGPLSFTPDGSTPFGIPDTDFVGLRADGEDLGITVSGYDGSLEPTLWVGTRSRTSTLAESWVRPVVDEEVAGASWGEVATTGGPGASGLWHVAVGDYSDGSPCDAASPCLGPAICGPDGFCTDPFVYSTARFVTDGTATSIYCGPPISPASAVVGTAGSVVLLDDYEGDVLLWDADHGGRPASIELPNRAPGTRVGIAHGGGDLYALVWSTPAELDVQELRCTNSCGGPARTCAASDSRSCGLSCCKTRSPDGPFAAAATDLATVASMPGHGYAVAWVESDGRTVNAALLDGTLDGVSFTTGGSPRYLERLHLAASGAIVMDIQLDTIDPGDMLGAGEPPPRWVVLFALSIGDGDEAVNVVLGDVRGCNRPPG